MQVRLLPPELCRRGRAGNDAGPSTRKPRVRAPPGVLIAGCGGAWPPRRFREPETAGSTPAGQTCCAARGRGAAVPASLMSSRPWVRIPPALLRGGVAQQRKSARLSGGRPPVRVRSSPLSWWPWCNGSIRGCDPRGIGSNPVGRPPCGRRAPASSARCNRVASGCGGSTPPVRTSLLAPPGREREEPHGALTQHTHDGCGRGRLRLAPVVSMGSAHALRVGRGAPALEAEQTSWVQLPPRSTQSRHRLSLARGHPEMCASTRTEAQTRSPVRRARQARRRWSC